MVKSIYPELNNKEWLYQKYTIEKLSASKIALLLGCGKYTIYRQLAKHEIVRRGHTSSYLELNDKEWLKKKYFDEGLSTVQIAKLVGSTTGNVSSHLHRLGLKIRGYTEGLKSRFPKSRYGDKAANWRGGKRVVNGYILLYKPEHPQKTNGGYVFEHILVAEKKLGRYLNKGEIVHHINGNKQDNRPENLEIVKRSDHVNYHMKSGKNIQKLLKRIKYLEKLLKDNDIIFS